MTRHPEVEFLCPGCEATSSRPLVPGTGAGPAGGAADAAGAPAAGAAPGAAGAPAAAVLDAAGAPAAGWRCPSCGGRFASPDPWQEDDETPRGNPPRSSEGPIVRCAVCGCPRLYVQKDFNRNAGLVLVAATALVSGIVLMVTHSTLWAMLVLGIVTAFDWLIYRFLPPVTVCYRCEAVHRGLPPNPKHEGFDIHIAEEFAYGKE